MQPINTEQQNPEGTRVTQENVTPEQVESTIEQVGQEKKINNINLPVQQEKRFEENETFVGENKKVIEEIKTEILQEFFKTQNMNSKPRATSEARKKIRKRKSTLGLVIQHQNKLSKILNQKTLQH